MAIKEEGKNKIYLLKRARDLSQGGQWLFQSGKVSKKDVEIYVNECKKKGCDLSEDCYDTSEIAKYAIKRELKEELNYDIGLTKIERLWLCPMEAPDMKKSFLFYLSVIELSACEIKKLKPNCTDYWKTRGSMFD